MEDDSNSDGSEEDSDEEAYDEESYEEESYEEESYEEDSSSDDSYYEESYEEEDTSYSGGGSSGSAIVAYADQFVGNPYVWGGNSLTNGIGLFPLCIPGSEKLRRIQRRIYHIFRMEVSGLTGRKSVRSTGRRCDLLFRSCGDL